MKRHCSILVAMAVLVLTACDGSESPTASTPEPPLPPPPPPATVEGQAILAVDLSNHLLLFGTGSAEAIAREMAITGLPSGNRIVEIDFRPSSGILYGVGNDSRVYTINPESGAATAVSSDPFSPPIATSSDIHFGMSFDPVTEQIRIVSAEGGGNWSIDPDDGTAVAGPAVRVVAGDPNEGATLHLAGLTAVPPEAAAGGLSLAQCKIFDALFVAIDPDLGALFSTCDPEASEWETLGEVPFLSILRCTQIKFTFGEDGLKLFATVIEEGEQRLYELDPFTFDLSPLGELPVDSPIQSFAFPPPDSESLPFITVEAGAPAMRGSESSAPEMPALDLQAQCSGAS